MLVLSDHEHCLAGVQSLSLLALFLVLRKGLSGSVRGV